jgi:hypothetical protein
MQKHTHCVTKQACLSYGFVYNPGIINADREPRTSPFKFLLIFDTIRYLNFFSCVTNRVISCGFYRPKLDICQQTFLYFMIDDNKMQLFGLFICIQSALHVSDDVDAHHQEHLTCIYSF